jgi:hypothetical protein
MDGGIILITWFQTWKETRAALGDAKKTLDPKTLKNLRF